MSVRVNFCKKFVSRTAFFILSPILNTIFLSYRFVSSTASINQNWQEGQHNVGTNYEGGDNKSNKPHFDTHITGAANGVSGFDASPSNNTSLFVYDKGRSPYPFKGVPNTDTKTLNTGDPYLLFVRGSRAVDMNDATAATPDSTTLRMTGKLKIGPVTQTFSNPNEFVLFGNPYQATVAMKSVASGFAGNPASTNINENHYYVYDPSIGTIGGYRTIPINFSGNKKQYLQARQAAQFEVLNVGSPVNVEFREDYKDVNQKHHLTPFSEDGNKADETPKSQITGELYTPKSYADNGPLYDTFTILFDDSYTNSRDLMDALKPSNINSENMGMKNEGKVYSIESGTMPEKGAQVQLYNDSYSNTEYTLLLNVQKLADASPYLKDNYTGDDTPLEDGENTYSFSVDQGSSGSMAEDRFSIHFETTLGTQNINTDEGLSIYPNPVQRGQ